MNTIMNYNIWAVNKAQNDAKHQMRIKILITIQISYESSPAKNLLHQLGFQSKTTFRAEIKSEPSILSVELAEFKSNIGSFGSMSHLA